MNNNLSITDVYRLLGLSIFELLAHAMAAIAESMSANSTTPRELFSAETMIY